MATHFCVFLSLPAPNGQIGQTRHTGSRGPVHSIESCCVHSTWDTTGRLWKLLRPRKSISGETAIHQSPWTRCWTHRAAAKIEKCATDEICFKDNKDKQ